ncbi:MAG: hypothetical protein MR346_09600 [Clostridium sp.]|nr:hypothetical protein [Clostridium sp.]
MHEMFRTVGQQVGMQDVRAILPESIDIFINIAIIEKARSIVMENTKTAFPNRVSIQNNFVSPINALRTLYRRKEITITDITKDVQLSQLDNVFLYTSFAIRYDNNDSEYKCRFIDGNKLEETLNDVLNGASWDYPICSMFNGENNSEYLKVFINSNSHTPNAIIIKYIANPAVVKFSKNAAECINCDLPDYLHSEIVELAVSKFFKSVTATSQAITE